MTFASDTHRKILRAMLDAAIDVARPATCLKPELPEIPNGGRILVVGAGKATAEMGTIVEQHYPEADWQAGRVQGTIATRHGYGRPLNHLELIESGHPTPDEHSIKAAQRALEVAASATPNDLLLVLLSGGASAIWAAPVPGVTLADKQRTTQALLKASARIDESNCVRRRMSRIKGGRLALSSSAPILTLAISDVPGDAPATIGSGPTVGDTDTLADARAVLARRAIDAPASVMNALNNSDNETPRPNEAGLLKSSVRLIARPIDALQAARAIAETHGFDVQILGDSVEGEARTIAAHHAGLAKQAKADGRKMILLSGGELTVTVKGAGSGGPNQEYALAMASHLSGEQGIHALAADTDGTDGGDGSVEDPAGAIITPDTIARASAHGMTAQSYLDNNDSSGFFRALDDLIVTGPTQTNVNDLRIVMIDPSEAE